MIRISEQHAGSDLQAGNIIREAAREMQGGGGGQPFFATAGGKDSSKISEAVAKAGELIRKATQDA